MSTNAGGSSRGLRPRSANVYSRRAWHECGVHSGDPPTSCVEVRRKPISADDERLGRSEPASGHQRTTTNGSGRAINARWIRHDRCTRTRRLAAQTIRRVQVTAHCSWGERPARAFSAIPFYCGVVPVAMYWVPAPSDWTFRSAKSATTSHGRRNPSLVVVTDRVSRQTMTLSGNRYHGAHLSPANRWANGSC